MWGLDGICFSLEKEKIRLSFILFLLLLFFGGRWGGLVGNGCGEGVEGWGGGACRCGTVAVVVQ